MAMNKEIRQVIRKMPMFSHVAQRLIEVTAAPDHRQRDVVQLIESDSVLTALVLKAVNSPAYALSGTVESVTRAAMLLGDRTVTALAIGQSAEGVFAAPLEGYEAVSGELWEHSLRTAIAARMLALLAVSSVAPDVAYTAGLMHDIGKTVLSEMLSGHVGHMVESVDRGQMDSFLDAERHQVGVDHCEAGAALADHWRLSSLFQHVCGFHHYPEQSPEADKAMVYVVHLADLVAIMSGSGTGADGFLYPMSANYQDFVDVDEQRLYQVMLESTEEFERVKMMLFA